MRHRSCPSRPASPGCSDNQDHPTPEPCGFQSPPRRRQNPRQPQNLGVASRSQENASEEGERAEMEREKKKTPQSGLWVSELNDQRGLQREKDEEMSSLETRKLFPGLYG